MGETVFGIGTHVDPVRVAVALITVVGITILLELMTHFMDHLCKDSPVHFRMLNKLRTEIMMMGVLSFIIFLSSQIAPSFNETLYYEPFEFAHIVVFFLALFLIIQSVCIMLISENRRRFDARVCVQPTMEIVKKIEENPGCVFYIKYLPCYGGLRYAAELKLMKHNFIKTYGLPESFDFSVYLSTSLDKSVLAIMSVDISSWCLFIVVALCYIIFREASGREWVHEEAAVPVEASSHHTSAVESSPHARMLSAGSEEEYIYADPSREMILVFGSCGWFLLAFIAAFLLLSRRSVLNLIKGMAGTDIKDYALALREVAAKEEEYKARQKLDKQEGVGYDHTVLNRLKQHAKCVNYVTHQHKTEKSVSSAMSSLKKTLICETHEEGHGAPKMTTFEDAQKSAPADTAEKAWCPKEHAGKGPVLIKHEAVKSVYMFGSPKLFERVLDAVLLFNNLYSSLWCANYVWMVDDVNSTHHGWLTLFIILPPILSLPLFNGLINIGSTLDAMAKLDPDTLGTVIEKMEVELQVTSQFTEKLRDLVAEKGVKPDTFDLFVKMHCLGKTEHEAWNMSLEKKHLLTVTKSMQFIVSDKRFNDLYRALDVDKSNGIHVDELKYFVYGSEKDIIGINAVLAEGDVV